MPAAIPKQNLQSCSGPVGEQKDVAAERVLVQLAAGQAVQTFKALRMSVKTEPYLAEPAAVGGGSFDCADQSRQCRGCRSCPPFPATGHCEKTNVKPLSGFGAASS